MGPCTVHGGAACPCHSSFGCDSTPDLEEAGQRIAGVVIAIVGPPSLPYHRVEFPSHFYQDWHKRVWDWGVSKSKFAGQIFGNTEHSYCILGPFLKAMIEEQLRSSGHTQRKKSGAITRKTPATIVAIIRMMCAFSRQCGPREETSPHTCHQTALFSLRWIDGGGARACPKRVTTSGRDCLRHGRGQGHCSQSWGCRPSCPSRRRSGLPPRGYLGVALSIPT